MLEDRRIYVEKLESESPKAYSAFRAYCEMGPERSLAKLSRKIGKNKSLLSRWSTQHSWVERANAYDMHLN